MSANARLLIVIDAQDKSKGAFSGVESALKGLDEQGKSAGSALGSVATQAAAAGVLVGGAVVAGVGKAVSVFADFEKGMSAVKAASGATAAQMGQLGAAAIALGQDTTLSGISATDAAKAMEELAKGGVSVEAQLGGATRGALLLASAGSIDVATAAGIATKAMNIFGLSGGDVAHVADLLSAGANKSATDVAHLGDAFNQSAAVAKSAGLSIEELTGTLAFLAQRGLEGSDAGTSLKTGLLALEAPTKTAAKTMAELGINVRDSKGEMLPLAAIADVLKDRLGGLSAAQRDAALKTIFGNDAIRVGIALYEGGGTAIRDWTASVNDAGNAARTGATKNDNLAGSLDQLKAVFETAAIQVGGKFAPAVRTAADELGKFVTKAMASPEVTKALEDLGTKGAAALTSLIAKVSDPAFQSEMRKWGTTALDVATTIKGLAGDIAGTLGPPLKAAADWFSSLDDQGRKNVVMFGLVAGAAIKFRDELTTLGGVVTDVIGKFAAKEVAKKSLQAANEGLAGSAAKTATAMTGTGSAAAGAAIEIASVAAVTAVAGAAAVGLVLGVSKAADALDQSGQRAKDNTQAWTAASFAIANGGTQANGAVDAFTRLVVSTGNLNPTVAQLSVLWNQYVGSLQAGGQSTDTLGLQLVQLGQFITGQVVSPLGEGLIAGQAFNNTLVGLSVGAQTLASSMTALPPSVSAVDQALGAVVISSQNVGIGLGTAAASMGAVAAAAGPLSDYSVSASAALNDLNTFGTSAAQGLNEAASAAMGAAMALSDADAVIKGLGQTAGTLQGYLRPLQAQWDELNKATENGKHVTDDQAAAYAELAPFIQYLNGQIGVNKDQNIAATEAAIKAYEAAHQTGAAYTQAAAAAGVSAGATAASGAAAHTAGGLFQNLSTDIHNVPTAVTTTASTNAAKIAGEVAGLQLAIALVPKSFTVTANVDISGALSSIQQLRDNMPHSPAKEGPFRVLPDWTKVFDTFGTGVDDSIAALGRLGAATDGATADLQSKIAGAASAMAKAITDTLGAISALANFDFAKDSPSGATLGWFSFLTTSLVATIVDAAAGFKSEALKAAGDFADTAGKVAGFIKNALDAFGALSTYDFAKGSPTGSALGWFRFLVTSLVATIAEAAKGFDTVALKAASDFADSASKVTGFVKGALDAFAGLAKYAPPAVANIYAFGKTLRSLMNDFALVAEQVTQQAGDAAGKFATAILPVVDVVGKGLDAFTKLGTYVAPPVAAIYAFGKTLRATINDFALLVEQITQEATDQAAKFAEGAGKVVGMIGSGVDAFTKLGDYAAPASAAIYAFGKTLRAVINDFALIAEQVTQDATDQAAKFATGAGTVVGIIGNAVTGLESLNKFVAPSQAAIDNFVYAVYETVRKIAEMASQMSKDGIKVAGEFGVAAGSVFGALKTALDVFTGLAKLVVPSRQAIDNFAIGIAATVAQLGIVADQIGKDGIKKAADFGASVQAVFGSLKSAMDMLTNLEKFKDVARKAFDSLLAGMQEAVQRAQGMVDQAKIIKLQSEEYAALMAQATVNFAKGLGVSGSPQEIGRKLGEGVISGARDAVGAHSPAEKLAELGRDITAGLVMGMTQTQQDAVKAAADLAKGVADAIQATLSAATALGKLDLTKLPTGGQITGLLGFVRSLVAEMAASATMLNEDGTKATSLFADTASKVASAVSAGITALTALVSFVAPASRAIFDFGKSLRTAVADLAALADELGVGLAEKAATFSEQATKAIAIFGSVSGFTALVGYVRPASKAIYDFGKDLMLAIGDLAAIVDLIGQEIADKAGKFGEMATKAVAVIGGGADSFTKLKNYARIPTKAIYDFGKDLMALVADFAAIVDLIGVEVANKAGQFADGAGKAVTVVGTALGSFSGLATFVTPGRAAVDGLLATVRYIIARFGEMATTMSTEGTKQLGDFGATTNAVLGGVKAAIDTFIALDKAVVPRTGDLSDLVVAVQGVTRNMATAAAALGTDAIKDATAFGTAAQGIFTALKSGLDLFIQIDKPGGWPTTDWLQPLIELMNGVLLRGGQLLTQSQELQAIADQFSANLVQAGATFGGALGLGDWALTGNVGGGGAGASGGGTVINNYYTVTGNTLLSKDTGTQQMVSSIVTATQGRTISYATSG